MKTLPRLPRTTIVLQPEAVADHLRRFRDPRMRNQIKSDLQNGGTRFDPPIREAEQLLVTQDNQ